MKPTLMQLCDLAGDDTKATMHRVLALLYAADRMYGGRIRPDSVDVAIALNVPLSDVRTAVEAAQVRGLIGATP